MAAIEALRAAVGTLRRSPVLFVGSLLYGLVVLPQTATQLAGVPLAPAALQVVTFFVTPFVVAGLLGMADEALDGTTSLDTFKRRGRSRYVQLLFGNLLEFAITFVLGLVIGITVLGLVLVVGVGGGFSGGFSPGAISGGTIVLVGLVLGLLGLVAAVVFFFIQFFPVAIVADGADAIEGFTTSVSFVRANLLSTLGYSIIRFVAGLLVSAPVTGFVLFRTLRTVGSADPTATPAGGPPTAAGAMGLAPVEALAVSLISVAVTMVLVAFQQTYAVAFYRRQNARATDAVASDVDFE